MASIEREGYRPKPSGYYDQARAELVARLPRPLGAVLDVGCAAGGAAGPLREAGATFLAGIELDPDAAARAAARYDVVRNGPVEDELARLDRRFDTILLYDVLEHLPLPEALLADLHAVAAPGARLHVSIPNARHWTLLRDLALRGTFGYTDVGHRDRTHLSWFTRRDLVAAVEAAGWRVRAVGHGPLRPVSRLAARATRGLTTELLVYQWSLLAEGPPPGSEK